MLLEADADGQSAVEAIVVQSLSIRCEVRDCDAGRPVEETAVDDGSEAGRDGSVEP